MLSNNNVISIHRGESFSIDKKLYNRDGSPYVVSNKFSNPHLLVAIASSKYKENSRRVYNYWLDISTFPRFLYTKIIDLSIFMDEDDHSEQKYTDWPTNGTICEIPSGYVEQLDKVVQFENVDDCVFSLNGEYKYIKVISESSGVITESEWTPYSFRLTVPFSREITKQWISQEYSYSINLVGGVRTITYLESQLTFKAIDFAELKARYESHLISKKEYTEALYELCKDNNIELPSNFSTSSELAIINNKIPILSPTKLNVLEEIQSEDEKADYVVDSIELENVEVNLDFSEGNIIVTPSAVSKAIGTATIIKPTTLKAENIKSGVTIAGITGTYGG